MMQRLLLRTYYVCHLHIICVKWACLPWSSRQRKDNQQEFRTDQRLHNHQTVDSVFDFGPHCTNWFDDQQVSTMPVLQSLSLTPNSNAMCIPMLCVALWPLDITGTLIFMPSVSPNHLICPLCVHTRISWEEVKCITLPPRKF